MKEIHKRVAKRIWQDTLPLLVVALMASILVASVYFFGFMFTVLGVIVLVALVYVIDLYGNERRAMELEEHRRKLRGEE
jgi:hypothetical protein